MNKINFNLERGFSDSITLTFNFIKQEIKPLMKSFAVIALPLIFVDMFVKSYVVRASLPMLLDPSPDLDQALGNIGSTLLSYLSTMVMYFWIGLYAISYIRVYQDKYVVQDESVITAGEVWRVLMRNFGKILLWGFLYVLMVVIGFMFLFIPGIYFAVIFAFTAFFIVLENKSISSGMSASTDLVKGQWWNFFGYLFMLQLIVGGLSYVFSIPYLVLTFTSVFTQEVPGIYETTFSIMFASLGQNALQVISAVGIAVRFFSLLEQKGHASLLSKIEAIGEGNK